MPATAPRCRRVRALGLRVAEVPTTLLSNAPFYSTLRGARAAGRLAGRPVARRQRARPGRACALLVSGYFGSTANGEAFADWLEREQSGAPHMRYCLDPVIGDTHTGPYVEAGLEKVFAERLLPRAWLVTPNAFELGRLTGLPSLDQEEAIAAARTLLARGPEWVLAHSVAGAPGELVTLAVGREATFRWRTPHLPVDSSGYRRCADGVAGRLPVA